MFSAGFRSRLSGKNLLLQTVFDINNDNVKRKSRKLHVELNTWKRRQSRN